MGGDSGSRRSSFCGQRREARHADLPFDVITDPNGFFHEHCGVGTSWSALWNFDALEAIFEGMCGKDKRFGRWVFNNPWFALPADFLLSADGIVQALRYGRHAGDQWSVDDLLAFRRLLDRTVDRPTTQLLI
jgi:hypothetical protein